MLSKLTNEELCKSARNGNGQARDILVRKNIKLVHMIVNRYKNKNTNIDHEVIFQEGCIGLIKAIYRFDEDYGFKFSTYAASSIESYILKYLRDDVEGKAFRIGRNNKLTYFKILKAKDELRQILLREPSLKDISEYMQMEIIDIERVIMMNENHTSIYSTVYCNFDREENDIHAIDLIKDNTKSEEILIEKMQLKENLSKLKDDYKKIIDLRYFKGLSQREVGKLLNVTQVTVSRRERKALAELKEMYIAG